MVRGAPVGFTQTRGEPTISPGPMGNYDVNSRFPENKEYERGRATVDDKLSVEDPAANKSPHRTTRNNLCLPSPIQRLHNSGTNDRPNTHASKQCKNIA
jgi:hypothetical protein